MLGDCVTCDPVLVRESALYDGAGVRLLHEGVADGDLVSVSVRKMLIESESASMDAVIIADVVEDQDTVRVDFDTLIESVLLRVMVAVIVVVGESTGGRN